MRWSAESWRAIADADDAVPSYDLPWRHDPATTVVARLDFTYRVVDVLAGEVPPLTWVSTDGTVELWWPHCRPAPEPFVSLDHHRWMLPAAVDLMTLVVLTRHGRLRVDLVTQVGVTADRRVVLADLGHWGELGIENASGGVDAVVDAMERDLGIPPLTTGPPDSFDRRSLFTAGRPSRGLWLSHRHGIWCLMPPGVPITPVGWRCPDMPESTGEPQQRSSS